MAQIPTATRQEVARLVAPSTSIRDTVSTCRHQTVLERSVPDAALLDSPPPAWSTQHTVCPACDCPLELRFSHPTAGGCLLWVEERWLAGRTWSYRRDGERWDAAH